MSDERDDYEPKTDALGAIRPDTLGERIRGLRRLDVEVALRAALASALPLAVLAALGRFEWAPYAAFGGMVAIYGRSEPYGVRLRTVSLAFALQVGAVGAGILLAVTGAPAWATGIALAVLLAVAIAVANTGGMSPPTPTFQVFAILVCGAAPTPADEGWVRLGVAIAAAGFAWLLAMSGWVLRRLSGRHEPDWFKSLPKATPTRPGVVRTRALWLNIGQNVSGGLLAGATGLLAGIGHPYWAVVSAVSVTPPAGAAHTTARALHRTLGTIGGVVVTWLILLTDPPVWALIVLVGLASFGAEVFIGRHYGTALLFITPLALLVAHIASPTPVPSLLVDRVVETAIGAAFGLVFVLVARAISRRWERNG